MFEVKFSFTQVPLPVIEAIVRIVEAIVKAVGGNEDSLVTEGPNEVFEEVSNESA